MKKTLLMLCSLFGLISCNFAGNNKEQVIDNSTVKVFDLNRFVGKWYEIARYEHRFEKGMSRVSATYTLLDNGKIEVFNQGFKDGEKKEIKGELLAKLKSRGYDTGRLVFVEQGE